MEQYPPAVNNEPTNQKPNRFKALAFLEIGVFEFFFVAVVLFLLFGTLNYFNILPVSDVFPKYLSWLPRRDAPHVASQQNKLLYAPTNPTPIPTMSYEITAKQILTTFLPNILSPILLPQNSQISIEQSKSAKTLTGSWDIKEYNIATFFTIRSNKISHIYLSFDILQTEKPSVATASTITSELFVIKPKGQWVCQSTQNDMTYCQNFWEENNGIRRGIGIEELYPKESNLINNRSETKIIFCEPSQESPFYAWKSCSSVIRDKDSN